MCSVYKLCFPLSLDHCYECNVTFFCVRYQKNFKALRLPCTDLIIGMFAEYPSYPVFIIL